MIAGLTSQKVAIPAALFLALSPGMILKTNGSNISFGKVSTSRMAVFFHALVFFMVYSLIAKAMGIVLTKTDLIVTTALFVALSPGMLLTLPPGSGGVFASGETSKTAMLAHTVVYAVVFALLRKQFPKVY
jgi:hypothetical protein